MAYELKSGYLGLDGVLAVRAVTRGFAAVTLREASDRWPDVIILRHPGADHELLDALTRGVRRNTHKVAEATALGVAAGVSFELSRHLIQSATSQPTPGFQPAQGQPAAQPPPAPAHVFGHLTPRLTLRARHLSGWWTGLTSVTKAAMAAAGVAALTAAAGGVYIETHPRPIALAGTWQVSDFVFSANSRDYVNYNDLTGGHRVFKTQDSCAQPCPLVVTEGPDLLQGVVMIPEQNASRYVGQHVPIHAACGNSDVPADHTVTNLVATRGENGQLRFGITVDVPSGWQTCHPWTARYEATATRVTTP